MTDLSMTGAVVEITLSSCVQTVGAIGVWRYISLVTLCESCYKFPLYMYIHIIHMIQHVHVKVGGLEALAYP